MLISHTVYRAASHLCGCFSTKQDPCTITALGIINRRTIERRVWSGKEKKGQSGESLAQQSLVLSGPSTLSNSLRQSANDDSVSHSTFMAGLPAPPLLHLLTSAADV